MTFAPGNRDGSWRVSNPGLHSNDRLFDKIDRHSSPMPEMTPLPRRRPLWRLFMLPVLLIIAAAAWSAFWFYAASQVDVRADAWRAQEAKSGRFYDCASRSVAGFPFRLEVRCQNPSMRLQSRIPERAVAQAPLAISLGDILVVWQIYDPTLLIAEFAAPAAISDGGGRASAIVNWTKGRSSVALADAAHRVSLVLDDASIDRVNGSVQAPFAHAKHVELHGRLAAGSSLDNPVIETALHIEGGGVQEVYPLLMQPFEADVRGKISGLKDFSPKPWPLRFREIQAAGGHIEIVQSRIAQGDVVAVAAGTISLNEQGRLDGELQMTVAGIEKVIPALGIDKMLDEGVPQATLDRIAPGLKSQDVSNLLGALDHAIPGLGKVLKQNANTGVAAGINALGRETMLEGKKALAFPLRFIDGAVFLGPLRVAQVPPLF